MERREVTPCFECGHCPEELSKLRERKPEFAEYRLFGRVTFALCIRCWMDYGSWTSAYAGSRVSAGDIEYMREIYPLPEHSFDFVCPECNARLAWLEARAACLESDAQ